jgi:L-fucose isomerase-like protein
LEAVSATGAFIGARAVTNVLAAEAAPPPLRPKSKIRVAKVYLAIPRSGWPKPDLDLAADVRKYEEEFAKLQPQLADVEFVEGGLVTSAQQLAAVKERFREVSGILAIHLNCGVTPYVTSLLELNVPLVFFAMPYAGHEWHTIASLQRLGKKIEMFPTSNYADLVAAVRPFRAIQRLQEAKVLYIRDPGPDPKYVQAIREKFGTEIINVPSQELVAAYQAIPPADAEAHAETWIRGAERVIEPPREDIVKGARMDLALFKLVEAAGAAAITINCLGMGLIDRDMGYPCLGFCRLNDVGLGGVCEADLKSTMTHLLFLNLVGKPGFVTDPVIDLATNTIIHAHCVSATKMDGPEGPTAPYIIRNHLEDHRGCVLQVKMRVGEKITMSRLIGSDILLYSTGEIVSTPDVDRGCRTKIAAKVGQAQKFLDNWSCGLHRVVFYGDHTADLRRFCRLKDIRLVNEETDDVHGVPGLEWQPVVHA